MQDIFTLTQKADTKLNAANDYYFNEQTETLLGVLRSSGVVPYNRTSQNGFLHKLFSASLVVAYNEDSPIYISSRKADAYLNRGMTTNTIKWLDRMCREELLVSEGYKYKAEGKCKLAPLINDMLSRVDVYTGQPLIAAEQLIQSQ